MTNSKGAGEKDSAAVDVFLLNKYLKEFCRNMKVRKLSNPIEIFEYTQSVCAAMFVIRDTLKTTAP